MWVWYPPFNILSPMRPHLFGEGVLEPFSALDLILNLLGNVGVDLLHVADGHLTAETVLLHEGQLLLGVLDHLLGEGKAALGILDLLGLVGPVLGGPLVGLGGGLVVLVQSLEGVDQGLVADGALGLGKINGGRGGLVLLSHCLGVGGPSAEAGDGGSQLRISLEEGGRPDRWRSMSDERREMNDVSTRVAEKHEYLQPPRYDARNGPPSSKLPSLLNRASRRFPDQHRERGAGGAELGVDHQPKIMTIQH